jgi:hypothetical protein
MLWIITADHINERVCKTLDEPVVLMVGKVSTRSATRSTAWRNADDAKKEELRAAWIAECNYDFRLLDDDGEVYYEGVCLDLERMPQDGAFEPLDWARYRDGCTRMDYRRRGETKWRVL